MITAPPFTGLSGPSRRLPLFQGNWQVAPRAHIPSWPERLTLHPEAEDTTAVRTPRFTAPAHSVLTGGVQIRLLGRMLTLRFVCPNVFKESSLRLGVRD